MENLFFGKKTFLQENFLYHKKIFTCGINFVCEKIFVENFLDEAKYFVCGKRFSRKKKLLLKENFLDEGKILDCGKLPS